MHLVPSEYATIQLAIDASINGDTVYVSNGTYIENINYNNKDLYLLGENRDSTIIDGNQNSNVVVMNGSSVLDGFTVQNGERGVDVTNSSNSNDSCYIINSNFYNNVLIGWGAGIRAKNTTTIDNCYFENNSNDMV